jgi:hypothetical protein
MALAYIGNLHSTVKISIRYGSSKKIVKIKFLVSVFYQPPFHLLPSIHLQIQKNFKHWRQRHNWSPSNECCCHAQIYKASEELALHEEIMCIFVKGTSWIKPSVSIISAHKITLIYSYMKAYGELFLTKRGLKSKVFLNCDCNS